MQTACASTRRAALGQLAGTVTGGTLAAAGVAVAQPAAPLVADPVLALAARYDSLERQGEALLLACDEEGGAMLLDAAWRAADEAIATAPTTWAGLIEQLRIMAERLTAGTRGERDGTDAHTVMRNAEMLAGRAVA